MNIFYVAGDSRAILIQSKGKVLPLSNDHRPERSESI
jgi:serine/threonine protein phosphatase PrpC